MSEVVKSLNSNKVEPGGYVELPSASEPTFPKDAPAARPGDGGSHWVVGARSATHHCVCGCSETHDLAVFGPLPVAKCCIYAVPFPLAR